MGGLEDTAHEGCMHAPQASHEFTDDRQGTWEGGRKKREGNSKVANVRKVDGG